MDHILLIETSTRIGHVGLARDDAIVDECILVEARRHARDLTPAIRALLAEQDWKAKNLHAIFVSRGPGSYTGLRVGIMTAKTLAYAIGCELIGVETFAAIARQAPTEALRVEVWADAQQGKVYAQRFVRNNRGELHSAATLAIDTVEHRLAKLENDCWLTGPGLEANDNQVPPHYRRVDSGQRLPLLPALLQEGLSRRRRGERDHPFTLEPLYLRPSAAEEKSKQRA